MKLPNGKNAYIPQEKLLKYLLSETHPVGKSKAKFFHKLGFNETNTAKLEEILLSIANKNTVEDIKEMAYGTNYVVKGTVNLSRNKIASIKTVWFIEHGQNKPRFVTAIPGIIHTKRGDNL